MGLKDYFKRTMEKPAPQPQVSGDYWNDLEGCAGRTCRRRLSSSAPTARNGSSSGLNRDTPS